MKKSRMREAKERKIRAKRRIRTRLKMHGNNKDDKEEGKEEK